MCEEAEADVQVGAEAEAAIAWQFSKLVSWSGPSFFLLPLPRPGHGLIKAYADWFAHFSAGD